MAWIPFDKYKKGLFTQSPSIDHDLDTFGILLLKNTWTPDRVNPVYVSDLSPGTYEVSGTNYSRLTLSNPTVTEIGSNTIKWDATEPATPHWAQSPTGFSDARFVVVFKQGTADTDSPVIAYHDFGADKGNVSADLSIQLDPNGIATL